MEKQIKDISSVPGVKGVVVCNNKAEIQASSSTTKEIGNALQSIAKEIVQMLALYEIAKKGISEIDINLEDGRVLVSAFESFTLVAICDSKITPSMVRLTMNVAAAEINADKKAIKQLTKDGTTGRWISLKKEDMQENAWNLVNIVKKT